MRTRLPLIFLAACVAAPAPEPVTLARAAVAAPDPLAAVLAALPDLVPPGPGGAPAPDLFSGITTMRTPGRGDPGYQILTEPTSCAGAGYTPFMACEGKPPQVGVPWRLTAWTHVVPSTDTRMAWLIVSWRPLPAPVDVTGLGAPGCVLQVGLDQVAPVPNGTNNALLQRSSGRITLTWTPTADVVGQSVWFQLLVDAPGVNPLGLVVGTALRATVQP